MKTTDRRGKEDGVRWVWRSKGSAEVSVLYCEGKGWLVEVEVMKIRDGKGKKGLNRMSLEREKGHQRKG